jgi:lysophospholipase L1-like esterase
MRRKSFFLLSLLAILIILSGCDSRWEDRYNAMYSNLSYSWAQSLEHADAEIAFFGDSRTILADWYSAFPDKKTVNLGVGGDRVEDLQRRMGLFDNLPNLKCCFVAIGVNNCPTMEFSKSDFKSKLRAVLAALIEKNLTVYINTVPGVTCEGDSDFNFFQRKLYNANVLSVNAAIKELANELELTLIDMAAVLAYEDGELKPEYSADGIHFNEAGNNLWYDAVSEYVNLI